MRLATRRDSIESIRIPWADEYSYWDSPDLLEPERRLWRAYFIRKYKDAIGEIMWDDSPTIIIKAREWFKGRPCHGITWEWVSEAIRIADHEKLAIEALIFSRDIKGV